MHEDGELLESVVDEHLDEPDPGTRRRLVGNFLKTQKERLGKKRPEALEGVFRRGERDGLVHYDLALRPTRAELFESGISQIVNPRSAPGQAARQAFTDPLQDEILAEDQESRVRHDLLMDALETLNEREKHILTERRLSDEPKTLEELSQVYGVSRERIRQIEVRAFEKLQAALIRLAGEKRLLPAA